MYYTSFIFLVMPHKAESHSPSPPPRGDRSSSGSSSTSKSRSRSRETVQIRARSWSPRRKRSCSPKRRYSEVSRDSGRDAGREYDDRRLHVANLDIDTCQKDMEQLFGRFGPLKEIWMARSIPCFAFVIYRERADTLEALDKADGREICGRPVRVTMAYKPHPHEKRGGGGFERNRRCFHCGDPRHLSRDCFHGFGYKRVSTNRGRGRGRGRHHSRIFHSDRRFNGRF